MSSGTITKSQLTASSNSYRANNGRLDGDKVWIAEDDDQFPWFQVNFITDVYVTAIATQGSPIGNMFVTEYIIGYGFDARNLTMITNEQNVEQV